MKTYCPVFPVKVAMSRFISSGRIEPELRDDIEVPVAELRDRSRSPMSPTSVSTSFGSGTEVLPRLSTVTL